jgi:hypothetical protein
MEAGQAATVARLTPKLDRSGPHPRPHANSAAGAARLRDLRCVLPPLDTQDASVAEIAMSIHMNGAQTRLDLLVDLGRYRRRCCRSGRTCARTGIGWSARYPLNARPTCCFTWIGGVDLRYGSTADQGRTGREDSSSPLWRPARALGTHAKQGPSTGHSAVGLRQPGKCLLTPRPHFTAPHARLVTRLLVLRTALLFVRSAVRLVYTATTAKARGRNS